jgi:hypothetical protein
MHTADLQYWHMDLCNDAPNKPDLQGNLCSLGIQPSHSDQMDCQHSQKDIYKLHGGHHHNILRWQHKALPRCMD